ncbi:hypothetical protein B0H14DRAFT_2588959 [Mycena olivaceomarginata]|nr:hypothetical protein B0H14DRAFT_2588959 [Mycena olivaceomarginata]
MPPLPFKFAFRRPHIPPNVAALDAKGDFLACGGIDGSLNVFSLLRGVHLMGYKFPSPISALKWDETDAQGSLLRPTLRRVVKVSGEDAVVQITSSVDGIMATTASHRTPGWTIPGNPRYIRRRTTGGRPQEAQEK